MSQSPSVVITIFTYVVRPSVRPFSKSMETKQIITVECIIDDPCLVICINHKLCPSTAMSQSPSGSTPGPSSGTPSAPGSANQQQHKLKYKNTAMDSQELRRRREEEGIQLRKQKREQQLFKRRNVNANEVLQVKKTCFDPHGRPTVIVSSDHCFHPHRPSSLFNI